MDVSNVMFHSNLQPVLTDKIVDSSLPSFVRDPFALEYMKKQGYNLTDQQLSEYRLASGHCSYAFSNDYPWGTIIDENRSERLACKCLNTSCSQYKACRQSEPDVSELIPLIDNEISRFVHFSDGLHVIPDKVIDIPEVKPYLTSEVFVEEQIFDEYPVSDVVVVDVEQDLQPDSVQKGSIAPPPVLPVAQSVSAPTETAPEEGFAAFRHVSHEDVINAPLSARMIVNAGPGTGKTWTLINRLAAMVDDEDVDPEDILVLSFSRAAVEEIGKRLKEAENDGRISTAWHHIDFSTLDSFATRAILWVMQNEPDLLPKGYSLSGQGYDPRIRTAIGLLAKKEDLLSSNVHVLIDEVQDLVGCRAELVLKILSVLPEECGFTILGDSCQALYDYQADQDPSLMTSADFYRILLEKYPVAMLYRFDENHRQSRALRNMIAPYRESLLTGTPEDRDSQLRSLMDATQYCDLDLSDPDRTVVSSLVADGTAAILTRSNGEALYISEKLKTAGIPHRLARPVDGDQLDQWIVRFFSEYPNQTIDRDIFLKVASGISALDDIDAQLCWDALAASAEEPGPRYHVEKILNGLLKRGRNDILHHKQDSDSRLTVTNVHRAKGREYDTVVVPDCFGDGYVQKGADPINEHKVCYVAFTRPRTCLLKAASRKFFVSRDDRTGRCFRAPFKKFKKQRYLADLEVGLPDDLDEISFAMSSEVQDYIASSLKVGDSLVLKREIYGNNKARYAVVPEDRPSLIIGYTSSEFSKSIELIKHQLVSFQGYFDVKYYPQELINVYVTGITACIFAGSLPADNIKTFGNTGIWYGFSMAGFAHVLNNTY